MSKKPTHSVLCHRWTIEHNFFDSVQHCAGGEGILSVLLIFIGVSLTFCQDCGIYVIGQYKLLKRLITKFQTPMITTNTIFARNYGTAAVISYNLKGIAPPVPSVQCWTDKNWMSGCEAPTLKQGGGKRIIKWYITTECMWKLDCPNLYCQRL
jgi:hypothetical protein